MLNVDVNSLLEPAAYIAGAVTLAPSMIGYVIRNMVKLMTGR